MDWLTVLLHAIQIFLKFLDLWHEKDDKKLSVKKEALNEAISAAADSDTLAITAAFDKYNSVR